MMRKLMLVLFCLITWSGVAFADCTATSFVRDFNDQFDSRDRAFEWCFKRVQWWDLDTSDGWRDRFCRVNQVDDYRWSGRFFHKHREFKNRYASGIFDRCNYFNYTE
jgi:hypothetical protein